MRLLITTQKVDRNDPVLGFFHRWIEEFASHCKYVLVVCLEKGEYDLPGNVEVYSLGKESQRSEVRSQMFGSKLRYVFCFYRFIWKLRDNYDNVFVHMNPEYVVLGGVFWRLWKKKIGLWYVHKSVNLKLRIAALLAHSIFTASRESFRLPSEKVRVLGHGIDTDFWTPDQSVERGKHFLSVGRLMRSKRHDLAIHAAHEVGVPLKIAGSGPERSALEQLARELGADVIFLGPLSQEELRREYRRAAKLVHRSETGSLDKVVLEAAACGLSVDTTDPVLAKLQLSPSFVRENHSLHALVPKIIAEHELC